MSEVELKSRYISAPSETQQISAKQIRNAYLDRDVGKSRELHELRMKKMNTLTDDTSDDDSDDSDNYVIEISNEEDHKSLGDYVKSMIYGGLDGIITTFAIVSGIAGAGFASEVILVLGFANLIADAISMGIGDYLSEKSEIEYIVSERKREEWEFEHFQEGEIQEMIHIYTQKGVSKKDAELILRTMSKYRDFFINHMMIQELELYPPTGHEQPVKGGFVTLISFLCFGCVPLLSYVALQQVKFDNSPSLDPRFAVCVILTICTLFCLGVFKGKVTESSIMKSAFFITFNGVLAASAAYLIAFALSHLTGVHG